jgi:hypothetical protein
MHCIKSRIVSSRRFEFRIIQSPYQRYLLRGKPPGSRSSNTLSRGVQPGAAPLVEHMQINVLHSQLTAQATVFPDFRPRDSRSG